MNVLFLSGWNKHRGKFESLNYNQSTLRTVLGKSGWSVFDMQVSDEASVVEAFASLDGCPLLVIYTGHGTGSGKFHPLICPVQGAFDLLKIPRRGYTSYIFDCCNVNDGETPLFVKAENHGAPVFNTACLNPQQGYIICMRERVCGFTRETGTILNLGMCSVMYHWNCSSVYDFCQILNGYCNFEYKQRNHVTDKRVHYVITLNARSIPRVKGVSELSIHRQMSTIKLPEIILPTPGGPVPMSMGIELIEHLGGPVSSGIEADESDHAEEVEFAGALVSPTGPVEGLETMSGVV